MFLSLNISQSNCSMLMNFTFTINTAFEKDIILITFVLPSFFFFFFHPTGNPLLSSVGLAWAWLQVTSSIQGLSRWFFFFWGQWAARWRQTLKGTAQMHQPMLTCYWLNHIIWSYTKSRDIQVQSTLSIHGGLVTDPSGTPTFADAQVPYIK